jgi:hypothetical protein
MRQVGLNNRFPKPPRTPVDATIYRSSNLKSVQWSFTATVLQPGRYGTVRDRKRGSRKPSNMAYFSHILVQGRMG